MGTDLNWESLNPMTRKILIENHSEGLLISIKLRELRSVPYTVQRKRINTTYELQHDKTTEMKAVPGNHLLPYYPKNEKIQELVENYVVLVDSDDYYTQYNKHEIAKYNPQSGAQHFVIVQWPIVEIQHSSNPITTH